MFNKIRNFIRNRTAIRRTYNELYALSDRELGDLGISRSEILHLAKQHGKRN